MRYINKPWTSKVSGQILRNPFLAHSLNEYLIVRNYVLSKVLHKALCGYNGDETTLKRIHFN